MGSAFMRWSGGHSCQSPRRERTETRSVGGSHGRQSGESRAGSQMLCARLGGRLLSSRAFPPSAWRPPASPPFHSPAHPTSCVLVILSIINSCRALPTETAVEIPRKARKDKNQGGGRLAIERAGSPQAGPDPCRGTAGRSGQGHVSL